MPHEYSDAYKRASQGVGKQNAENKFYGYAYDGVWAMADS